MLELTCGTWSRGCWKDMSLMWKLTRDIQGNLDIDVSINIVLCCSGLATDQNYSVSFQKPLTAMLAWGSMEEI